VTPVSLTQRILAFNTVNPPGHEEACARFLGDLLAEAGFSVQYHQLAAGRPTLIAELVGPAEGHAICFSGHLDTVPFDEKRWGKDPLGGEIDDGKLYGRGASDMKSGIGAMVLAALRLAHTTRPRRGLLLVLSAGEERGCRGAHALIKDGVVSKAGALVVGEPTSNYPMIGHKGTVWLEAHTSGTSAHASMPEQGDNAIYKAARAITDLEHVSFVEAHPLMGSPTLNVGIITGGTGINVVPDRATFTIDVRTIPGLATDMVIERLQSHVGSDVELTTILDAPSVCSDPDNAWVQQVFDIITPVITERPVPRCVTYFTDASVLAPALGNPPTVILGPGEASQAHRTDEYCYSTKIEEAAEIYYEIARRWVQAD
jgi:succinyl-diaminopimelate desuccinylase